MPSAFLSSTMDSAAACRASARCAGQSMIAGGVVDHGTRSGGSKRPSLNLVASRRRSERSISASVMSPSRTATTRSLVGAAAVEVAAVAHRQRGGLGGVFRDLVVLVKIVDGAAVADHVAAEAPALAQRFPEQPAAGAARLAQGAVVGAHHGLDAGAHELLEGGQIGFREILRCGLRVENVALRLRAAVHRKVLRAGRGLEIMRMVALQPAHHGEAELAGQERILAEGFLAAAPARVAKDIDVGRPEREALILAAAAGGDRRVMLGARLVGNDARDPPHQRAVPGGAQADDLRERRWRDRCDRRRGSLVPPVVGGHAEPRHRIVLVESWLTFSGRVRRATRSSMRSARGSGHHRTAERRSRGRKII
jgi:hypothetical protein